MSYHARDGLFFERLADGSVRVTVRDGDVQRFAAVLPPETWASVLAQVSARGETYDTWNEARQYHTRK